MVQKHVHAAIITELYSLSRNTELDGSDQDEILSILTDVIPSHVKHYLFDDRNTVRPKPKDIKSINMLTSKYHDRLLMSLNQIFTLNWPVEDKVAVDNESLKACLNNFWFTS